MAEPQGEEAMSTPLDTSTEAAVPTAPTTPHSKRRFWKLLLTSPSGLFAVIVLAVMLLSTFGASLFTRYSPIKNDLSARMQMPSAEHVLGTDALGRDLFSRVLHGGRPAFTGVAKAILLAVLIGVPMGILAGYFGGRLDAVIGRIIDVAMSIPGIILLLMAMVIFGGGQGPAMYTLGVLFAPGLARVARGSAMAARAEPYVAAARVSGLSHLQIMIRHIWPRVMSPVVIRLALLAASALLIQAGLSFLGFGTDPPYPAWGYMVAEGASELQRNAWLIIPPGATVALVAMAFVLLGDAIRDATQGSQASVQRMTRGQTKDDARLSLRTDSTSPEPQVVTEDSILTVSGLTVEIPLVRGWTTIVRDVSFRVQKGEAVAIVGESGCGKTVTALSTIGMTPGRGRIAAGSVIFNGKELVGAGREVLGKLRGREIGFIAQEPMVALDPSYTVGSQLNEAVRRNRGLNRREAREVVMELLRLVKLPEPEEVARRYPHEVSGGMAQRVVIARALAGRPSLLIADEPTTALDATVQAEILDLLRSLQKELGMSMIFVTHDWGVVADIADRAVVMYAGQGVEYGTAGEFFARPLHPYTLGLMRANPHLVAEGERIETIAGSVPPPGEWPVGCHFAARCFMRQDQCTAGPIALGEPESGRRSRCLRAAELARMESAS